MKPAISDSNEQGANTGTFRANRTQRLRSNRTAVDGKSGASVMASATHASLGELEAVALDVSIHGARLSLRTTPGVDSTVLLGDRLDPLTLRFHGATVFEGSGTITRSVERNDHIELGVELHDATVQLDQLHRASARRSAQERWAQAQSTLHGQLISPQFRAWVSDVAGFLHATQLFLDREEKEIAAFDRATQEAVSDELLTAVTPDIIARMNAAALELGELVALIPTGAEHEHRAFVQSRLNGYMEAAPFIWRAKHKPLGYAGDYEMMNMLYRDHREGATLFAKALNVWATQQPGRTSQHQPHRLHRREDQSSTGGQAW